MSAHKFFPITASLLARKGEAFPSAFFAKDSFRTEVVGRVPHAAPSPVAKAHSVARTVEANGHDHADPHRRHEADRPHKIRVALSDAEYEKLGLAAVKHNVTRHQLIREAIDTYVDRLIRKYRKDCRCIGGDGSCSEAAGACGS